MSSKTVTLTREDLGRSITVPAPVYARATLDDTELEFHDLTTKQKDAFSNFFEHVAYGARALWTYTDQDGFTMPARFNSPAIVFTEHEGVWDVIVGARLGPEARVPQVCQMQAADVVKPRPRHLITVAAVIVTPNACFLAGRRKTPSGKGQYGCPGGSLEFGETPMEAVIRETYEETGITLHPERGCLIDVDIGSDEVMGQWVIIFYRFDVDHSIKAKTLEPEKTESWGWYQLTNPPLPLIPNLQRMFNRGKVTYHGVGEL